MQENVIVLFLMIVVNLKSILAPQQVEEIEFQCTFQPTMLMEVLQLKLINLMSKIFLVITDF